MFIIGVLGKKMDRKKSNLTKKNFLPNFSKLINFYTYMELKAHKQKLDSKVVLTKLIQPIGTRYGLREIGVNYGLKACRFFALKT